MACLSLKLCGLGGDVLNRFRAYLSNAHLQTRARAIEMAGFAIIVIALWMLWPPVAMLTVGVGVVAGAYFMRGTE